MESHGRPLKVGNHGLHVHLQAMVHIWWLLKITSGLRLIMEVHGLNELLVHKHGTAVASDQTGQNLVAGATNLLQTSPDSGVTWLTRKSSGTWRCCSVSSNGTHMLAGDASNGGYLYTSTDSGTTWIQQNSPQSTATVYWNCCASSVDGMILYAGQLGGLLYQSIDSGQTWSIYNNTVQAWSTIACSGDGTMVIAVNPTSVYLTQMTSTTYYSYNVSSGSLTGNVYDSIELMYDGTGQWIVTKYTS